MIAALSEKPQAPQKSGQKILSMGEMLSLAGEIGYLIALPAFAFGFGGAYLDKTLGTKPWLMIAGLGLALTISIFAVYRIVKRILFTS